MAELQVFKCAMQWLDCVYRKVTADADDSDRLIEVADHFRVQEVDANAPARVPVHPVGYPNAIVRWCFEGLRIPGHRTEPQVRSGALLQLNVCFVKLGKKKAAPLSGAAFHK